MRTNYAICSIWALALLVSFSTYSQDRKTLETMVRTGLPSERVKAAIDLSDIYTSENKDSLESLGENLFYFGIDEHYFPAIETGKLILAEYYVQTGRSTDGIATAKALIGNIQERGDERQMSIACKIISQGYRNEKDATSAFHWAEQAVKHSSRSEDPEVRLYGLISLAEAYVLKQKTGEGIKMYKRYIKEATPLKKYRGLSAANARLGDLYRLKGDFVNAEKYFMLSYNLAKDASLTTPLGHAINNLAIVYFEKGDTIKARKYFELGLKKRQQANDVRSISESYYNLGDYEFYIGKPKLAEGWYMRSYQYAKLHSLKSEQKDALYALANLHKENGEFEKTTLYLEQYIELEAQLKTQDMKDEEEIRTMQLQFMKMEAQAKSEGFLDESTFWDRLKWEWIALVALGLCLVYFVVKVKSKEAA